uniref:ORFX protein n=1 Tax=Fraxinus pennsylvanica waikavirus TaxID=3027341 RepID=A0AA48P9M3_9SECO|nr:TPA_asm: ORFX protein [Fraxinus pennsylvanica waikavirus]
MIIALTLSGLVCHCVTLCLIFIGLLLRIVPLILVGLVFGFLTLILMISSVLLLRRDVEHSSPPVEMPIWLESLRARMTPVRRERPAPPGNAAAPRVRR